MKLLIETVNEPVNCVIEESADTKEKQYYFEGIYLQSNLLNRNGRIYPREILQDEVRRYTVEYINKNRALGELNHPNEPTLNLDRVCHNIVSLKEDINNWVGKSLVMGEKASIIKEFIDRKIPFGVSSRGLGSLQEKNGANYVNPDFKMVCIDCVFEPSAPQAYVEGLSERNGLGVRCPRPMAEDRTSKKTIKRSN